MLRGGWLPARVLGHGARPSSHLHPGAIGGGIMATSWAWCFACPCAGSPGWFPRPSPGWRAASATFAFGKPLRRHRPASPPGPPTSQSPTTPARRFPRAGSGGEQPHASHKVSSGSAGQPQTLKRRLDGGRSAKSSSSMSSTVSFCSDSIAMSTSSRRAGSRFDALRSHHVLGLAAPEADGLDLAVGRGQGLRQIHAGRIDGSSGRCGGVLRGVAHDQPPMLVRYRSSLSTPPTL